MLAVLLTGLGVWGIWGLIDPLLASHKPGHGAGTHTSLRVGIPPSASLTDDGRGDYVHKEFGVTAVAGGETQPNKPGIRVELKDVGTNPREVTVDVACEPSAFGDCSSLPPGVVGVERANLTLAVRPYEVNCPADGTCPDVFTMGQTTQQMSFRVGFFEGPLIEIASAIGGASSPNPGRCLSFLSEQQRTDFLTTHCTPPENCNVAITASDSADSDNRNDSWTIQALNDTALICDRSNNSVIGVAHVSFTMEAKAK